MPESNEHTDLVLDSYRSYLLLLARMQLDDRARQRIDASDVVQQTLLEAHQKRGQFQGPKSEVGAWLRVALANNIRDALRKQRRQKRDVARQRSLEAAVEESSQRLGRWLAADVSSPSMQAIRNEDLLRMADALVELPEAQRDAVVLHHLHGWTISEVAKRIDRSNAAVAGLLHRGLRKLRELMTNEIGQ